MIPAMGVSNMLWIDHSIPVSPSLMPASCKANPVWQSYMILAIWYNHNKTNHNNTMYIFHGLYYRFHPSPSLSCLQTAEQIPALLSSMIHPHQKQSTAKPCAYFIGCTVGSIPSVSLPPSCEPAAGQTPASLSYFQSPWISSGQIYWSRAPGTS